MSVITPKGHMAPDIEVLPNGGVVLVSKSNSRYRVVLAKTHRDFVTWLVTEKNGEVSCDAGHYHGKGVAGLQRAIQDFQTRR